MSLKPVWCGESFFAPQAGTSASRSTLSVPPGSPKSMASNTSTCRAEAMSSNRLRPSVPPSCRRTLSGNVHAACSASTARTPKPSSAHSTLPMPSTSASIFGSIPWLLPLS